MFDLYLYPFGIKNNQEYSTIPGFLISTAPKKTSRNRMDDILLLYYANHEEIRPVESQFLTQLLPKTKDYYFKISGPITTAIKKTAEFLNDQILQFNLKQLKRPNLVGALQILVMHENEAYIMHAGDTTSFLLSRKNAEKHYDSAVGGQGIGVSRGLRYKFHHVSINTGDRIVMVSKPPKKWTVNTMSSSPRLSISHLRRLLISEAEQDFETVVIQFRPGNRSVHILKLNMDPAVKSEHKRQPAAINQEEIPPVSIPEHTIDQATDDALTDSQMNEEFGFENSEKNIVFPTSESINSEKSPQESVFSNSAKLAKHEEYTMGEELKNYPESGESETQQDQKDLDGGFFISGKKIDDLRRSKKKKSAALPKVNRDQVIPKLIQIRTSLQKFSTSSKKLMGKIERGITTLISRSTPGDVDAKPNLSGSGMLFIALIVPIIVVAVSMTVYLQNKNEIFQEKILDARNQINLAVDSEDVPQKIAYYQSAMTILDEAETYGSSDALINLRNVVQTQLDGYSGITRIDIQPSIAGGLVKKITITKMVTAIGEDVYALDESTGHVIRMIASKPDYTIDNDFICGPGKHGEIIVSNLIDIEPITVQNSEDISIIGIDAGGNLLLCSRRGTPIAIKLQTPDLGWGGIAALAFDGYTLYILDNGENTRDIYTYEGNALSFNGSPTSLFEQNIPENLQNIIDMALYQDDLYMLQNNGVLSRCNQGNAFVETKCELDIGYGRIQHNQIREVTQVLENTQLQELFITQPPDPSIYFLDTFGETVYHFSLAINMQKQIKPNLNSLLFQPDRPLSAVTVSPSGVVHFAYGHQTYFGELP